jgi:hypothetical protein
MAPSSGRRPADEEPRAGRGRNRSPLAATPARVWNVCCHPQRERSMTLRERAGWGVVRETRLIGGATNVEPKKDLSRSGLDLPLHEDDVIAWNKRQKGGLVEVGSEAWSARD